MSTQTDSETLIRECYWNNLGPISSECPENIRRGAGCQNYFTYPKRLRHNRRWLDPVYEDPQYKDLPPGWAVVGGHGWRCPDPRHRMITINLHYHHIFELPTWTGIDGYPEGSIVVKTFLTSACPDSHTISHTISHDIGLSSRAYARKGFSRDDQIGRQYFLPGETVEFVDIEYTSRSPRFLYFDSKKRDTFTGLIDTSKINYQQIYCRESLEQLLEKRDDEEL